MLFYQHPSGGPLPNKKLALCVGVVDLVDWKLPRLMWDNESGGKPTAGTSSPGALDHRSRVAADSWSAAIERTPTENPHRTIALTCSMAFTGCFVFPPLPRQLILSSSFVTLCTLAWADCFQRGQNGPRFNVGHWVYVRVKVPTGGINQPRRVHGS